MWRIFKILTRCQGRRQFECAKGRAAPKGYNNKFELENGIDFLLIIKIRSDFSLEFKNLILGLPFKEFR